MKLKPISLLLLATLGALSIPALATEPVTVRDIRVEGLQRTDAGTVFSYLPVKVGGTFDDTAARESIKALFATGFFDDVRTELDGDVLVITVQERPTIAQISITGAKMLEKDQIRNAMKSQGFAEGRIFQQDLLDAAVNELKQQYFLRGRYAVDIKATQTRLERNRVGVEFDISEGAPARIKRINLVGARAFQEKKLLELFSLTTSGWLTWYTSSDQYSKPKLTGDLEKLRSYYQDRGYLDFNVDSTQVEISEDREEIYLTINVTEGEKYTIGEVRFAGDMIIPEADLRKLVQIKSGDVFSREKVNRSSIAIGEFYGEKGYAFANVNPVPEVDKDKRIADFTFYVDPGKKTYVRRVNISGNSITRDEVIRREMRQMEAAPFDGAKIKRSRQRLDQLDYFSEVNIETPVVPDAVDQVDVNVAVTEKKTGSFNIGAGFGQSEGLILIASLSQANFLGSGKTVTLEANTSSSNKTYSLGVVNPYATPDGISFGWNLYTRKYDASEIDLGEYSTDSMGAGMTFGLPVSEENRINLSLNAEKLDINTVSTSPRYVSDFVARNGNSNKIFTIGAGWSRDTRDSASYPKAGKLYKLNAEIETPGSTTQYVKLGAESQMFYSPFDSLTAMWNIEAGYGKAYGGSDFPFYKHYYAGGIGSVRGFESGSLSQQDEYGNSIGGTRRFVNNFEFLVPMPGAKDDRSMRLSAFYDMGAAWAESEDVSFSDLRHSAGVAFTWISPIGPLKLSVAAPIKKKSNDKTENFQFQLGHVF